MQRDDARQGDNIFVLQKAAARTTEYNAATGECYIKIDAGAASPLGGINVSQFLEKQPDGTYLPVRPSLLVFKCRPE